MKNLLLASALTIGSALSAFSQGTVTFANDASTLVTTNDFAGHFGPATVANGMRVVLYYSTAAVAPAVSLTDLTGWTLSSPTGADIVGTPVAGRFSGGTQTLDQAAGGSSVWVMVRGWTGGFADWASAYAAAVQPGSPIFLGLTSAWLQPTGNPGGTPPTAAVPMVLGPSGFNGLALPIIPEPSTFALIGLAAGSAFLFGRRRVIRK